MLEITIPDGALAPQAEANLMAQLTNILLKHEGVDPTNPIARSMAWIFMNRPSKIFVAGVPALDPRYRVVVSVPVGQFNDKLRSSMVAAVTDAILDAEEGTRPRDSSRIWVFASEVPEGTWGYKGQIFGLADIAGTIMGDLEKGREYAKKRLANPR
jgi:phenylpyruvate tautomerase PptA (4-oxalocrotonate tautomerase family)